MSRPPRTQLIDVSISTQIHPSRPIDECNTQIGECIQLWPHAAARNDERDAWLFGSYERWQYLKQVNALSLGLLPGQQMIPPIHVS